MKIIASRVVAAIVSAVVVVFCANTASAAIYEMTFSGTVSECCTTDAGGYFGPANGSVYGDAYVATYVYDPSAQSFAHDANNNLGGLEYSTTQPILAASITINSHTYNVDLSGTVWTGDVEANTSHALALLCTNYDGANCGAYLYNQLSLASGGPNDLTTTGTWSGTGVAGDFQTADEELFLTPTSVTIQQLPTPLPATLPLFASGLAGLGLLARRRKKKAAAVAAV